jgi:hypothetical protein
LISITFTYPFLLLAIKNKNISNSVSITSTYPIPIFPIQEQKYLLREGLGNFALFRAKDSRLRRERFFCIFVAKMQAVLSLRTRSERKVRATQSISLPNGKKFRIESLNYGKCHRKHTADGHYGSGKVENVR